MLILLTNIVTVTFGFEHLLHPRILFTHPLLNLLPYPRNLSTNPLRDLLLNDLTYLTPLHPITRQLL